LPYSKQKNFFRMKKQLLYRLILLSVWLLSVSNLWATIKIESTHGTTCETRDGKKIDLMEGSVSFIINGNAGPFHWQCTKDFVTSNPSQPPSGVGKVYGEGDIPNNFAEPIELSKLDEGTYTIQVCWGYKLSCCTTLHFNIQCCEAGLLDVEVDRVPVTNGSNGSITIKNIKNGGGTYSYTWVGYDVKETNTSQGILYSYGNIVLNSTSKAITNLKIGFYHLIVKDGCKTFDRWYPMADCTEQPIKLAFNTFHNCTGYEVGAIVFSSPTAAHWPYQFDFTWSNGVSGDGVYFIDKLKAGDYSVTAQDITGCLYTQKFVVEEHDPQRVRILCKEDIYCDGDWIDGHDYGGSVKSDFNNCQFTISCDDGITATVEGVSGTKENLFNCTVTTGCTLTDENTGFTKFIPNITESKIETKDYPNFIPCKDPNDLKCFECRRDKVCTLNDLVLSSTIISPNECNVPEKQGTHVNGFSSFGYSNNRSKETIKTTNKLSLYNSWEYPIIKPNPFENEFTISFHSEITEELKIELYDVQGRRILQKEAIVTIGTNQLPIRMENDFPAGSYMVRLTNKEGISALHKVVHIKR
jgi:hypothetical protein